MLGTGSTSWSTTGRGGWIRARGFYNSRLWTVQNHIRQATFSELDGYPELNDSTRPEDAPRYFGHGVLAVGDRVYQFLTTLDRATETAAALGRREAHLLE